MYIVCPDLEGIFIPEIWISVSERTGIQELRLTTRDITDYYFRFSAVDSPGVLSKISGILGAHNISIASVIQKRREENGSVPVVMLTHEARECDVRKSLEIIDKLDIVTEKTVLFRVEKKTGV